jgi:hypothetical protein
MVMDTRYNSHADDQSSIPPHGSLLSPMQAGQSTKLWLVQDISW